jgi:hypothetical protein
MEMLHTSDVAAILKIDPKVLRKHLRAISGKAPGTRYEWKPNDPFLKKLPGLIKAREERNKPQRKRHNCCPAHSPYDVGFLAGWNYNPVCEMPALPRRIPRQAGLHLLGKRRG